MKIPNILTIIRIILIPIIALLLLTREPKFMTLSVVLFVIAIITDWLDGYIARKYDQKTVFGTFMDPIADKMLILTIFFILSALGRIPVWMPLLILFREFLVSGIRQVCSTKEKIVGANWMGKTKFVLQAAIAAYGILIQITGTTPYFNDVILYYATLTLIVLSYIFVIRFVYWHRKQIFSDF